MRQSTFILALAALALAFAGLGQAATCTAADKEAAQAAVSAYQKKIPKERAAYFRKHRSAKLRKAFVKKQQAKLKKLRTAAACEVPPPPPPPPPAETIPPALTSANATAATVTLVFDEPLSSVSDVSVTLSGAPVSATSSLSGSSVTLTLPTPIDAGSEILVNAKVRDLAGNETSLVSQAATNTLAAGASPALQKGVDDSSFPAPDFGEAPIDHSLFLPSTGVRVVMLFADFPSRQFQLTPQQVYDAWVPVAKAWFRKASFGRFGLQVDLVDKVYHLPKDDYGQVESGGGGGLETLIHDVATLADPDVNFSGYDAIWVVDPGGFGVRQLRLRPQNALVLDGKPILHAELADAFIPTGPSDELGHPITVAGAAHQSLTHELGHHLGIPDTSYKPDPQTPYDFTFVGGWDLQDSPAGLLHGADYFAWNKWRLGWIDANQIRALSSPGSLETTLAPVETAGGVKMIVIQTSPTFLYAVEVRRHVRNDAQSTCDDGVLVYTVDSTKRNGEGPVHVLPAQPSPDASRVATCGAKYAAPFDLGPGEVSTFDDTTVKVEVLSTDGVNYRVRVTRKALLRAARPAATCTAEAKQAALAALAAYRKKMPKDRAAYFKKHKRAKLRKAFVKKQQAKLRKLQQAAACEVPPPPPPPPPQPPPPPPPPPAPAPVLQAATGSGTTITLAFDKPISSITDVGVSVSGSPVGATSSVSGSSAVLTLANAVDAGSEIFVNANVTAADGGETTLVSQAVTNTMAAGFAPALEKQSWADTRYPDQPSASPEFGEWPIDYQYHLRADRVRILMLFVDQPNREPMYPPQQVYDTWTSVTKRFEKFSSYGRFDLQFDRTDKVYRLSKTDYTPMPDGDGGTLREVVLEATHLAGPDVDFSKYDVVWVVGTLGIGNRRLRTWPENRFTLDGKLFQHAEVADYYLQDPPTIEVNGHRVDNSGAAHQMLTHELGHHLGLPDLSYKPDPQTPYDFTRVAGWDMQDNPAGLFGGADYMAWNKWRLRWIDANQIRGLTSPGTVTTTIAPDETAGGVKLVVAQTSPSFLYAVEVRRHKGNDANSTCDEGVLVYTVDSTKRNGVGPKFVETAHMGSDPARISTCGAKYEAPFDLGPGEVSTFEDANVKVEVLSTDGVNYRVRVTKK